MEVENPSASNEQVEEPVSFQSKLKEDDIVKLLKFFAHSSKKPRTDTMYDVCQKECLHMFSRDFDIVVIPNQNGEYCPHYPNDLLIPVHLKHPHAMFPDSEELTSVLSSKDDLSCLFAGSRQARCRERFVIPSLVFNGKAICRSATLTSVYESYYRSVVGTLTNRVSSASSGTVTWIKGVAASSSTTSATAETRETTEGEEEALDAPVGEDEDTQSQDTISPGSTSSASSDESSDPSFVTTIVKARGQTPRAVDVSLLEYLQLGHIFDLMVEEKKVKYHMYWSSSEKVVDEVSQYKDFYINTVPYPGCEYFREVTDNNLDPVGMVFDWEQPQVTESCGIKYASDLPVAWSEYKRWDLVELTQNYLRVMVECLVDPSAGGILVHCISGWDRTPLFTSLIRLSLWADGLVHQSLDPLNMLFFTIAYDWVLFGHQFSSRLQHKELIFFFCFNFLIHITDDAFSAFNVTKDALKGNTVSDDVNQRMDGASAASGGARVSSSPDTEDDTDASSEGGSRSATPAAGRCTNHPFDSDGHVDSAGSTLESRGSTSSERLNRQSEAADSESQTSATSSQSESGSQTLQDGVLPMSRRERLLAIRSLFINTYRSAESDGAFDTSASTWSAEVAGLFSSALRTMLPAGQEPGPPE